MENEQNDDNSFDYDENDTIDDDEVDSILSGESGRSNRRRNIPDITLYKLLTKKRKCIHFFFKKIIMISFIPTLIYNLFWIIIFNKIDFENLVNNFKYNSLKNYILIICYIVLIKGIVILIIPQILCVSERSINDFSYICVIFKIITTLFISIHLKHHINKNLNLKNIPDKIEFNNNDLFNWITLYYKLECYYIKGVISFFLLILTIIIIKIGKELFKSIRYAL
jgi:hypothetical protein